MVIEVTEANAAETVETVIETLDAAVLDPRVTEVLAASTNKTHTLQAVIIENGSERIATETAATAAKSASGTGIGSPDGIMATGHRGGTGLREGREICLKTGGVEVEEAAVEVDAATAMASEARPVVGGTGRRARLHLLNRRSQHPT